MSEYNSTNPEAEVYKFNVFIDVDDAPMAIGQTRSEMIEQGKRLFEEHAGPVKDAIRKLGGFILSESFLAEEIQIGLSELRVEAGGIEEIRRLPHVIGVEVPLQLQEE